ncbi:MAG: helix-turn-helix domain-containing protein [Rhodospirillaceae bacterium]
MSDLKQKVFNLISGGHAAEGEPARPAGQPEPDTARIGAVLRATRVQAGLELRDVATMLKIRHTFMEAIEDGRYQELPGTAYAVGFVRTYAEYLGLDGDVVVRRFKDEVAGKVGQQSLYFPTPVPEGRVPGGAVLLVSLLLAAMVYGGWYVMTAADRSLVDVVPALPQRLVSLLGSFGSHAPPPPPAAPASASAPELTPSLAPAAEKPAPAAAPAASAPAAPSPAVSAAVGPAMAPKVPVLPPGAPVPAPPPAPAVAPAASPTASAAAPAAADAADASDEVPLVSGPSDENSGGPGPLVPMTPRIKPLPPALAPAPATDALPPGTLTPGAAPLAADSAVGAAAGAVPAAASAVAPAVAAATPSPAPGTAPAAAKPAAAAPAIPPTSPSGRVFGNQGADSRVQIKATQDTWVQIREASGEAIFTKVLHAGDIYRVPDRPGMNMRTGNAGGLQIVVDNGDPAVLGSVGEVLRDILVDGSSKRPTGR